MKNSNKIADKFETNKFSFDKSPLKALLLLVFFALICFALVSGVSAKTFNSDVDSNEFQDFIRDDTGAKEIVLNAGDYNNLKNLNITRSVTISSNGQVNIKSNGGILFNVTASNVTIIGLNISGYQTAINTNGKKISIIGNNISTTGNSIYCW
jgi:hypothetical protein